MPITLSNTTGLGGFTLANTNNTGTFIMSVSGSVTTGSVQP